MQYNVTRMRIIVSKAERREEYEGASSTNVKKKEEKSTRELAVQM